MFIRWCGNVQIRNDVESARKVYPNDLDMFCSCSTLFFGPCRGACRSNPTMFLLLGVKPKELAPSASAPLSVPA